MGREYSFQAQNIETIWDFISRHLTYYADSFSPLDIFAFIQVIAGFAKRFGTDEMKESVAGITATYYDKLIRNYRFVGPKNMSLTVRTYFE